MAWDNLNDGTITGYQVRSAVEGGDGTPDWTRIEWSDVAGSDFSTTRHEVTGLTNGTAYVFQVRAQNASGAGPAASATATPFPAAPANLTASAGVGAVTLSWNNPGDAAITVYQLKYGYGTTVVQDWSDIPGTGATTTTHTVASLTGGKAYTFNLRAAAGLVHGDSSVVKATPRACPAVTVGGIADTTITLGQAASLTAAATGGAAPHEYSLSVTPETGSDLSIDEEDGSITGTPTATGSYTVTVTATDADGCMGTGTFTLKVCTAITVTAPGDATVTVGQELSLKARATGGCGTVTFKKKSGSGWVTVHANGNVRGTAPSTPGKHKVTITATDTEGYSTDRSFTITVRCNRLRIADIPDMTVTAGAAFSHTASVGGGCGSRTSSTEDSPDWVKHRIESDGDLTIHGTAPSTPGTHGVTVRVRDANGNGVGEFFRIEVEQPCEVSVNAGDDMAVTVGENMERTVTATSTAESHTFSLAIAPSSGMSLSIGETDGRITGSASEAGTYTVTATASASGCTPGMDTFDVTVTCPTISVSAGSNMSVLVGDDITRTVTATGGVGSHSYALSIEPSSGLDLSIGETDGGITGSATKAGTYTVTVKAGVDNAPGCARGMDSFEVTVACPTITVAEISDVTVTQGEQMETLTATASGGKQPYTYTISGQPSGVDIVASSGVISGAPTQEGRFNAEVTATDSSGCTGTRKFKIDVQSPCEPVAIETISDIRVTVGDSVSLTATVNHGCEPVTLSMTGAPSTVKLGDVTEVSSTTRKWPIAGPAAQPGTYDVTLTATDSHDPARTDEERFTITVVCLPLTLGYISDVVAQKGVAISAIQARASGGCAPLKYTLSSSPTSGSGLSVGASNGRITGTPTAVDTFAVTVKVTDASDASKSRTFEMRVAAPLSVDAPDVWEAVDEAGTWNATVTVTDADRRSKSAGITVTIYLPGDYNGDGRRDAADAKLFNMKLGLRRSDAGYDRRMDLNHDGIINYADFVILSGYIERDASSGSSGG